MAEIFNNYSSFRKGFGDKSLIPDSAFAVGPNYTKMILPRPNARSVKSNWSNLKFGFDIADTTSSAIGNFSDLIDPFWVGENNTLYMKYGEKEFVSFSKGGIKFPENRGGVLNRSQELANARGSGLINGINHILNIKISNSDWAEYSVFSKEKVEPYTVGSLIRDINFVFTINRVRNYFIDYQGNNHTKDGVDLIFELIGYLGPVGVAYSITYSLIDQYYPGGIRGYAEDLIQFSIDCIVNIPYSLKYYGHGINKLMEDVGRRELNSNHFIP